MANQEQLDILKQGVEIWNRWRSHQYSGTCIDLRNADLSRTRLNGADLSFVVLSRANLSRAHLDEANLIFADLSETNLSEASLHKTVLSAVNLRNANLHKAALITTNLGGYGSRKPDPPQPLNASMHFREAHIDGADLRNADLSEANLRYANLDGALLDGANFSHASVGGTLFVDVNLRLAKGLETVRHDGPSRIGIDTIYLSHGEISEIFLRGAGVPDSFISYVRSLVGIPTDFYSCLISYSSKDQGFAKRLYADLQRKGVRCWFAPEDLKIGDHYHQRIDESIHLYDKLVLILSEQAVQSAWVEREVVAAREKEDRQQHEVLFPIRLDDAVMNTTKAWAADVRRRWHIGDFTQWEDHDAYQQAFGRLLHDLKAEQKTDI